VKIYDLGTGQMLESLNGHKSWVRDISFSPDGNELLSCGDDSRIITWNLTTTGHLLKSTELKMHLGWLLSIDRYSDGKTFACGSILGKAMLLSSFGSYKLRTGNPINKILFKPDKDPYFKLAVATRGKGAFLVDLSHATFK
jgi:WD40 repeat protein